MIYKKINDTYTLQYTIEAQPYVSDLDISAGPNQMGVRVIPPDKVAVETWVGDVGIVYTQPVYNADPALNVDGSFQYDLLLDQDGIWEVQTLRAGLNAHEVLDRTWVLILDDYNPEPRLTIV